MKSTICVAEDRKSCEPTLKILLLSLAKFSPGREVNLFYPAATDDFVLWLGRCPMVRLQKTSLQTGYEWNIKPQALMRLMNEGFEEVIWIDSDVFVAQDLARTFNNLEPQTIVATEDALGEHHHDPDGLRARLWGFTVGRVLPFGLNTGIVRVTSCHRPLLERWWELLQSDVYQESQRREWGRRPVHMLGDQDVLTALLSSNEFSKTPIHILRRGKQIIQFDGIWGFSVAERIAALLRGYPMFIHQFGHKPWSEKWHSISSLRDYVKKVYVDLSPYTLSARQFKNELDCDIDWMDAHYTLSKILRFLAFRNSALCGLPLAIFADLARLINWGLRIWKSSKLAPPLVRTGAAVRRAKVEHP